MAVWVAVTCAALFVACVANDRKHVEAAREAFDRCTQQYPTDSAHCDALREELLVSQERYEANARRAWGCDPVHPDCPTRR